MFELDDKELKMVAGAYENGEGGGHTCEGSECCTGGGGSENGEYRR